MFRLRQDRHKLSQGLKVSFWGLARGKFSVNIEMNDFVGSILQSKFFCKSCCYILLSVTHFKRRCIHSPYPIHAADGYYIRDSSCITLLWLQHNHKVCVATTKRKLVGYQNLSCSCVRMEFVVGAISLSCELFSVSRSYFRSCVARTTV